jgi:hypothetical protein
MAEQARGSGMILWPSYPPTHFAQAQTCGTVGVAMFRHLNNQDENRPMKSIVVFMFASALLSSTPANHQSATDSASHPFHISSMESGFSFAGVFDGKYVLNSDSVEIDVEKATISLRDNAQYHGRRRLVSLTVGLAVALGQDRWKIAKVGNLSSIDKIMKPGDQYDAQMLHFSIPRKKRSDLSKNWLVFQIEERTLDLGETKALRPGHSYAHSERDIFVDSTH